MLINFLLIKKNMYMVLKVSFKTGDIGVKLNIECLTDPGIFQIPLGAQHSWTDFHTSEHTNIGLTFSCNNAHGI